MPSGEVEFEHPELLEAKRERGAGRWPFWSKVYAQGDPLPDLSCTVSRPSILSTKAMNCPPNIERC